MIPGGHLRAYLGERRVFGNGPVRKCIASSPEPGERTLANKARQGNPGQAEGPQVPRPDEAALAREINDGFGARLHAVGCSLMSVFINKDRHNGTQHPRFRARLVRPVSLWSGENVIQPLGQSARVAERRRTHHPPKRRARAARAAALATCMDEAVSALRRAPLLP